MIVIHDRETYTSRGIPLNDRPNPLVFTVLILRAMGSCSSCCKSDESPEREPLLPKPGPRNRDETAARYTDKVADVVGALEAGCLPSQAQIDHAFRSLLNSDLLKVESTNAHLPPPHRKELATMVDDVKEVVAAMLEVGGEKNGLSAPPLHSAPSLQEVSGRQITGTVVHEQAGFSQVRQSFRRR